MIFEELRVPGAFLVRLERRADERGFFARAWCRREFEENGLETDLAQANVSLTRYKGTLRGIHFQVPPAAETKLVRCMRGAAYYVVLDLRPTSPTHHQWVAVELRDKDYLMLYAPEGCAIGFQTLADDTEMFYLVSRFYSPEHERGIRWNDPAFQIRWPEEVTVLSDKDRAWPDFASQPPLEHAASAARAARVSEPPRRP